MTFGGPCAMTLLMSTLNHVKEEIKQRLALSAVVGQKAKLTKAGREHKACCPFHSEKSPSFYVNDEKAFYHCFGCGAHGDHFTFVMEQDKLSFFEAMQTLADQAGVKMPEPEARDVEADKRRERLYQANNAAAHLFESLLHAPANSEVLDYVRSRGLNDETIRNFRLGYAPEDGSFLVKNLQDQGFNKDELIEAGLARESNGRVYSFFRDRVMFPVSDRQGRIIAFGGRILPEYLRPPSDKAPKYLNTGDTPLFNKSHTLYAQALARQAAAQGHGLLVVEGYTDVIALHQHGFKGAVAPLGTALTENQIELLWAMDHNQIKEPVLAFDGDKAGRSAAIRAMDRALPLLKPGYSLKVLFLPEGEDPDTLLLRHGAPAMRQVTEQALPLVDFVWDNWRAQMRLDTPEAKAHARAFLREQLDRIQNQDVKATYKQELTSRLDSLLQPAPRTQYANKGKVFPPRNVGPLPTQNANLASGLLDRVLLASLFVCPKLVEYVEESLGIMELSDSSLDKLRQFIISEGSNWAAFSQAEAVAFCEMKGFGDLVTGILNNRILVHTGFARDSQNLQHTATEWLEVYARRQSSSTARPAAANTLGTLERLRRAQAANDRQS